MKKSYTVQTKIQRPVDTVFAAIINPDTMSKYFTDKTSGALVEGNTVTWSWHQWGDYPVKVKKVVQNQLIHLEIDSDHWKKTDGDPYKVDIFLEMEAIDENATMLTISEAGWKTDEHGLKGSHENCSGWTHMAMCLKAYLEHDIDMR
jgi:uncharacterized protein YndB with AHSA1/START domain